MRIKYVLWLVAIGHLALGIYGLYAPEGVANFVGFELLGAGAYGEVRAIFGGLIFAMGLAIIRGAAGGVRGRQWLFAMALAYTGLFAGRVVSLAGDGGSAHTLVTMALEGGLAGFLLFAAGQLGSADSGAVSGGGAGGEKVEDVPRVERSDVGSGGPA